VSTMRRPRMVDTGGPKPRVAGKKFFWFFFFKKRTALKLDASRVDAFLRSPGVGCVLIYGPDSGLVSARGLALARSVPGALNDPFRFSELHAPSADALLAEATAAALGGGRRVVRVRDAGEGLAKAVESLVTKPPEALVIIEAGELTPRSKLRALAEKMAGIAAIACYAVEPARLPALLTQRLRAAGKALAPEAASWAAAHVPGEEGPLAQAVELLLLYAGEEPAITLEDVQAALADGGATSLSDAVDAALTGDVAGTDRTVSLAYQEGTSPIAIIRVLLSELLRLRLAAAQIAGGAPVSEAVAAMRPPVFFKRQPVVMKMLQRWTLPALGRALELALAAELACKQTMTPDEAFCRQMLLNLAARRI
jgi:DNA polymerase-3 subunit delta